MAISLQVGCVRRAAGTGSHGGILGIGGRYASGSAWYLSEAEAIELIQKNKWKFYVSVGGKRVEVRVAKHGGGAYLLTDPDPSSANSLESLPPCPSLTEEVEPPHPVWDPRFP